MIRSSIKKADGNQREAQPLQKFWGDDITHFKRTKYPQFTLKTQLPKCHRTI